MQSLLTKHCSNPRFSTGASLMLEGRNHKRRTISQAKILPHTSCASHFVLRKSVWSQIYRSRMRRLWPWSRVLRNTPPVDRNTLKLMTNHAGNQDTAFVGNWKISLDEMERRLYRNNAIKNISDKCRLMRHCYGFLKWILTTVSQGCSRSNERRQRVQSSSQWNDSRNNMHPFSS